MNLCVCWVLICFLLGIITKSTLCLFASLYVDCMILMPFCLQWGSIYTFRQRYLGSEYGYILCELQEFCWSSANEAKLFTLFSCPFQIEFSQWLAGKITGSIHAHMLVNWFYFHEFLGNVNMKYTFFVSQEITICTVLQAQ